MPRKLENKLKREARAKGLFGRRAAAYVYGTMNKLGFRTGRRRGNVRKI